MHKIFTIATIAKNTFTETLRQPIYAVIIFSVLLLMFLSPSLTMYAIDDDNKLLREIGLSTLFLAGLFIAIFSASAAIAEEIRKKTIITVMTKPVQRPIFIVAKFFGVGVSVGLAHYICSIALLMAIRYGVAESADNIIDWPVLAVTGVILAATLLLTAFLNYVYEWKFSSTAIVLAAIFSTIGIIFLFFIDHSWKFNPQNNGINALDIYGSVLLFLAAIVFAALAVMLSTRFNIVVTLCACIGIFLLGLISDYVFGNLEQIHLWAKIGRFLVPNLQVFWISDAIYEESQIPFKYIVISGSYALSYTTAILFLAIALFQRRQVG